MPEEHDADEKAETGNHTAVNRRQFVKTVGAVGSAGSLMTLTGTALAEDTDRKVIKLSDDMRRNAVSAALSDQETQKLLVLLARKRWIPEPNDATAFNIRPTDGEPYRYVTFPFEKHKQNDSRTAFLSWTDHDGEDKRFGESTVVTIFDSANGKQIRFGVEGEEIVTDTIEFQIANKSDSSSDDKFTPSAIAGPPGGGGGGKACVYFHTACADPNWSCLASIGLLYATCAGALIAGNLYGLGTCIAGSGLKLFQAAENEGCRMCDRITVRKRNICGVSGVASP